MLKTMKSFDWSRPQRQPAAGLAIAFLNTFWEVAKRLWPLLLLMLFGKEGKVSRYEIVAIIFLAITILTALMRFLYFRFYLEENKLVIKTGWLNKETKIIPLEKIQTVNIEQGPLHQLLNVVKLSIDTAGSQKAEATIDSIHLSMAEALREKLLSQVASTQSNTKEKKLPLNETIIRLNTKDLLKLSISANHLEAFFILLSFGIGLYDNISNINQNLFSGAENYLPNAVAGILFLSIVILLFTILVSTIRIFLRFYDFKMTRNEKGYQSKSGLTNIRERLVAIQKIQFISWKANWIRRLMNLWMLEYHVAVCDGLKNNLKVQVPVTRKGFLALLTNNYHPLPDTNSITPIRMHPVFIIRRFVFVGLLPALVLGLIFWWFIGYYVFLFLIYSLIILVIAWAVQRKFRLWIMEDVLFIKKGLFGEEWIMMFWHKMQNVSVTQSYFQRRSGLANITFSSAGGSIGINYITHADARKLANLALYKTESSSTGWM